MFKTIVYWRDGKTQKTGYLIHYSLEKRLRNIEKYRDCWEVWTEPTEEVRKG
jgi:hypothetical protein